jgi:uncharacterized protein
VETRLSKTLPAGTALRCRVTHAGVAIEVEDGAADQAALSALAGALCRDHGRHLVGVRPYRRGAMFVRG